MKKMKNIVKNLQSIGIMVISCFLNEWKALLLVLIGIGSSLYAFTLLFGDNYISLITLLLVLSVVVIGTQTKKRIPCIENWIDENKVPKDEELLKKMMEGDISSEVHSFTKKLIIFNSIHERYSLIMNQLLCISGLLLMIAVFTIANTFYNTLIFDYFTISTLAFTFYILSECKELIASSTSLCETNIDEITIRRVNE